MISEVTIKLVGAGIPVFTPIGATINYGINKIPTAAVQLDPSALGLLCDFDRFRRLSAKLIIETTNGCIHFNGVIDGLSFSQSPGGLVANLILKHEMQWLTELYPRMTGLHPLSEDIFQINPSLKVTYGLNGSQSTDAIAMYEVVRNMEINFRLNVIDWVISLLTGVVKSNEDLLRVSNDQNTTAGIQDVLSEGDVARRQLMPTILRLLASIDTTATKPLGITASSGFIADQTINSMALLRDNIFTNLVRLMSEFGCCVVVGDSKTFVVPEATFLNVPKALTVYQQQRSRYPNIIYPSEYDNVSFNDNGYACIKGVYITADAGTSIAAAGSHANVELGRFIDHYGTGNILVRSLPALISYGLVEAATKGSVGLQRRIRDQAPLLARQINTEEYTTSLDENGKQADASKLQRDVYMNQWAQMEYCRMKYDDRTGVINSSFHNNWAPGCVGSLYTRQPGTYIDFFVTDVTHSFQLNPPNSGRANTTIQFKGGRIGPTSAKGLDSIELYKYDYPAAYNFCQTFIKDIA